MCVFLALVFFPNTILSILTIWLLLAPLLLCVLRYSVNTIEKHVRKTVICDGMFSLSIILRLLWLSWYRHVLTEIYMTDTT